MLIRGATASGDAISPAYAGKRLCSTLPSGDVPTASDTCLSSTGIGVIGCTGGATFRNAETKTITIWTLMGAPAGCPEIDTGRDKNRYNVTIFYSWLDNQAITHQLAGELLARKP